MGVASEVERVKVRVAKHGAFFYKGDRFLEGEELEIPKKDYLAAQRLFQLVEKSNPKKVELSGSSDSKGGEKSDKEDETVGKGAGVMEALKKAGDKMVKKDGGRVKGE